MADNSAIEAHETEWAYEQRLKGHTYRAIADMTAAGLGYPLSKDTVQRRIEAHLAERPTTKQDELRAVELDKLDALETAIHKIIARHHYVIRGTPPECVRDPEDPGQYLDDDGAALAAFDRLLKVQERRAKLKGLDSPVEVAVDATIRVAINGVDPQALT